MNRRSLGFRLNENNPYQFADKMENGVADHRIDKTIFPVQVAKDQAETAIEQKAAEQDQRCQFAKDPNRCRQVSGSKHKGSKFRDRLIIAG